MALLSVVLQVPRDMKYSCWTLWELVITLILEDSTAVSFVCLGIFHVYHLKVDYAIAQGKLINTDLCQLGFDSSRDLTWTDI